jgi:hypothetical protein
VLDTGTGGAPLLLCSLSLHAPCNATSDPSYPTNQHGRPRRTCSCPLPKPSAGMVTHIPVCDLYTLNAQVMAQATRLDKWVLRAERAPQQQPLAGCGGESPTPAPACAWPPDASTDTNLGTGANGCATPRTADADRRSGTGNIKLAWWNTGWLFDGVAGPSDSRWVDKCTGT